MKTMFSILMCTYNSSDTLRKSIDSVICQTDGDWELLILDNGSTDDSIPIVREYEEADDRIRLYLSEENVGWAKGTSVLLPYAEGEYMHFLAADDFFMTDDVLSMIRRIIKNEDWPDIIFTKHKTLYGDATVETGHSEELSYDVIASEDRVAQLRWAAENLYYNSMSHFERVDYLKSKGINFFEPFFVDNVGMTEAILQTNKYCVLNNPIYALTFDTSKTRGRVIMIDPFGVMRWRRVNNAMIRYGCYDEDNLAFLSNRFLRLDYNIFRRLCMGAEGRDKLMNPIDITDVDRIRYCEDVLSSDEHNQLVMYAGAVAERSGFYEGLGCLCLRLDIPGSWLCDLIAGLYEGSGDDVHMREKPSEEDVRRIVSGLTNPDNRYVFGFDMIANIQSYISDSDMLTIIRRYGESRVLLVQWLKGLIDEINNDERRQEEAERIKNRCKNMLEEIKLFIDETTWNNLAESV